MTTLKWIKRALIFCSLTVSLNVLFAFAASAQVTTVYPPAQDILADPSTEIRISFALPVNSALFSEKDLFVFGRWSGVMTGIIEYEENDTVLKFSPDKPFMAGEWVTVSLSKHVETMGGTSLGTGYTWNFWTRAQPGTFDFQLIDDISTREPGESLVRSYGAYAGDLNRDGYSDLMIPNEVANDIRIFYNDQAGGYNDFIIYPIPNGSVPSTNEGSDFNRDGMIDFAIGNTGNDLVSVWMGENDGSVLHKENTPADENIRGLCVMDLDGDAVMDIVTANRTGLRDDGNISLLINDGSGNFSAPANIETNSKGETACASIDANGDGILDVFIGAYEGNEVLLFLGDGAGNLSFSDKQNVGNGPWMLAAGDVNGDGFADVVSSNTGNATVSVILGNGDGSLQSAAHYDTGAFPLAIDLGDLDGDGDLDLVTSNFSSNNYTVLENEGNGSYSSRLTLPATTAASCTILHDRDNDGDLDITGIDELADRVFLFDNVTEVTTTEPELPYSSLQIVDVYPNPSGVETRLVVQTDLSSLAKVAIYNMLGQQVYDSELVLGSGENVFVWDGRNDMGERVVAGVYLITLTTNESRLWRSVLRK